MKGFVAILLLLIAGSGLSQTIVQGSVKGPENEPIGFAHIYNQSLGLGKVSDMNGKFQLLANKGDTIKFSYVGYQILYVKIEPIHLANFMKVMLPKDSMLLPSIVIYADRNFRVPINFKGEPIFISGVSIPNMDTSPYQPGSLNYALTGVGGAPVPGVAISGPISYFTKEYQEKRKAEEVYQETAKTITYQKYIAQDTVRAKICELYDLDTAEYDKLIVRLNETFPGIQEQRRPQEIWLWLLTHFDRQVPIIKN